MTSIKTVIDKNKTINILKVLAGSVVPQYQQGSFGFILAKG